MTQKLATFRERYVGPDGPHLSQLTETSLKGTYTPATQRSIHPRVFAGKTYWSKVNTNKTPKG